MRLPSPAMVVALIALIVAMSGSAYAVTQLPKNSVGAVQLKRSAVTSAKLANNAVTNAKIRNNAITSAKIRNGTIQVADLSSKARTELKGATGPTGPRGEQGPPGVQSYAFAVGEENVQVFNVSGRSADIGSFTVTTPTAGFLLMDLNILTFDPDDPICVGFASSQVDVDVLVGGTPVPGLARSQIVFSSFRTYGAEVIELAAGTHSVTMRLTCPVGVTAAATPRSTWNASGALYPARLTAATNTG